MKRILSLILLIYATWANAQVASITANSYRSRKLVTSNSSLTPAQAEDSIGTIFTKGLFAKYAQTNYAGTSQATHGQDVLSIKETIANSGKAVFVGNNGTASAVLTNPITAGGFQSSTFPVAGVGTRSYPQLDTNYGGSVDIFNGRCKYYEFYQTPDQSIPFELWFITRPKPTIVYEYELSGFGGFGWRRNTNGALLQWAGQSLEYTRANDGTSFPNIGEVNIMHFKMRSDKSMVVRMTNSDGDLIYQDSLAIGTGTYYLRNQYIGSNGHPDNFDFYGYFIKYGQLTPTERNKALIWFKTIYPIGLKPNKPHCIPTISTSGSGASLTWTVSLNYNDGGTLSPIDLNATTIRWYYCDQNASYSGGNWLDTQGFIRTTDGNTLSLTRTLANTLTGNRYVVPGDNNTLMNVDVDCYSIAGKHHKPWPSAPVYNSLP